MQQVSKQSVVVKNCKQVIDKRLRTYSLLRHFRNERNISSKTRCPNQNQRYTKYDVDRGNSSIYFSGKICGIQIQVRNSSYENSEPLSSNKFSDEDTDKFMEQLEAASLKKTPYGYYEILGGIPRKSKMSDIKHAYFRLAKRYHPDAYPDKGEDNPESRRKARIARFRFDEITEAYQTLMDINQRHFYDEHGYAPEALRKQGLPNIFDYVPKYGIYEEQILSDNETTGLEDWFKSQGHSVRDPNITLRQMIKNAYIELRWGFAYHNFPWKLKEFFLFLASMCVISASIGWGYGKYVYNRANALPDDHPHKPIKINNMWENDEKRDILQFYGVRKTRPSMHRHLGVYHMPKTDREGEKRKQNMLEGKLFSEGQYKSWKKNSSKDSNIERHRSWIREEKQRKINTATEKREYWESRIAIVVGEIEKFKLEEHIIKKSEDKKEGKSSAEILLSNEEYEELMKKHSATNMVALNSKLNSAKNELEEVLGELETLNAPVAERIEDQYILPPTPSSKDFKVIVGEANLSILDTESYGKLKIGTNESDLSQITKE